MSHETYTPARGGSAAAEINALRSTFGPDADSIVITNTKGFTGHAMGAGIEDVVAIKALETGIVPPVPNYKEPDPALGELNLSLGGAYPVRYALRLAAGFGSQIAMSLLRWTPPRDGRHRAPDELGYAYRITDAGGLAALAGLAVRDSRGAPRGRSPVGSASSTTGPPRRLPTTPSTAHVVPVALDRQRPTAPAPTAVAPRVAATEPARSPVAPEPVAGSTVDAPVGAPVDGCR